ncbi:MAG: ACT domain-containing protein [Frisingicoccus sp.]
MKKTLSLSCLIYRKLLQVCLSGENNVNILDISQTIVQDYFNMMMIVDTNAAAKEFEVLSKELKEVGEQIGVKIKMQHEDIFNCMHRI